MSKNQNNSICASTGDILSIAMAEKRCLQMLLVYDIMEIKLSLMATAMSLPTVQDICESMEGLWPVSSGHWLLGVGL